jgi:hypothetical protein
VVLLDGAISPVVITGEYLTLPFELICFSEIIILTLFKISELSSVFNEPDILYGEKLICFISFLFSSLSIKGEDICK